ncbi:hypothetical protein [Marinoscillum sp. MHG1-6]|uniref:hypothetical protein n=1 Tax=Marinoscillum sp. MHG1-6 TaxID=2959627 RepID=UPI0021577F5F|nr:hypothetical protein [Marinoscillum sp. MHG1-6]
MKRLTIYFTLLAIATCSYGQKVKYEVDLNRILTLPVGNSVSELSQWKKIEPENPSIAFQLGVLYKKRYESADPLMNAKFKYGNAELAMASLKRAELLVDEKEVKRNEECYFNFGRYNEKGKLEVSFDTVTAFIKSSQTELSSYLRAAKFIQEEFQLSFHHYDLAHKIYLQILGEYPTFKELYLLYDENVNLQFEKLSREYLSFLEHWKTYKAAEDTFDIGYDQKIQISEIQTYRLDGLQSEINFLKNDIEVWDYAKWVNETRERINTEIGALRKSLITEDIRLKKELANAPSDFRKDEFQTLIVAKEVLFNLRRYDLNSLVEPLLIYKEKQHDLIRQKLLSASLDSAGTDEDRDRKLYLYGQTLNKIILADRTLVQAAERNDTTGYKKYQRFVDEQYNGADGISAFVKAERRQNANDARGVGTKIKNELYEQLSSDLTSETIVYRGKSFQLSAANPVEDGLVSAAPITTHQLRTFDGAYVIGGIFRNEKENKTQAFVCALTPNKRMAWYNEYLLKNESSGEFDSHTRLAALEFVPGGVALILNASSNDGLKTSNQLIMLDEKGDQVLTKNLAIDQYPRTMSFIETSHTLFVTFKGHEFSESISQESDITTASYNLLGELQWQKKTSYKGDIVSVVIADNTRIIIGDFNEIRDLDDRTITAGPNQSGIYALKLDTNGDIIGLKTVTNNASLSGNIIYKVSDNCINIFGTKGAYVKNKVLNTDPASALHLILNSDLDILSSSLD